MKKELILGGVMLYGLTFGAFMTKKKIKLKRAKKMFFRRNKKKSILSNTAITQD